MLNQNWFTSENFVMFCDYAEYQLFYDTETKNIYEINENVLDKADTIIREFTPENPEYRRLYRAYESCGSGLTEGCKRKSGKDVWRI